MVIILYYNLIPKTLLSKHYFHLEKLQVGKKFSSSNWKREIQRNKKKDKKRMGNNRYYILTFPFFLSISFTLTGIKV